MICRAFTKLQFSKLVVSPYRAQKQNHEAMLQNVDTGDLKPT